MFSEINIGELSIREKLVLVGFGGMFGLGQKLAERLLGKRLPDERKQELREDGNKNLWLARMAVKEVAGDVRRWIS